MPFALFSNDAKLSKAYPPKADVGGSRARVGLVVDVSNEEEKAIPQPVLDNDYEIRPCNPEPNEDPPRNKAEAEGDAWTRIAARLIAVEGRSGANFTFMPPYPAPPARTPWPVPVPARW